MAVKPPQPIISPALGPTPTQGIFDLAGVELATYEVEYCLHGSVEVANPDRATIEATISDSLVNYRKALLWAAARGQYPIIDLVLRIPGSAIDARDGTGRTPLSLAAGEGHDAIVGLLLDDGSATVDAPDSNGATPLSWAAARGHRRIVQLLLRTGKANVNHRDKDGSTPLCLAAREGQVDAAALLLEEPGVDIDLPDIIAATPLSWAAARGRYNAVMLFLKNGKAATDSQDEYGQTPLSLAANNGHIDVVRLLLNEGNANASLCDVDGATPLIRAVSMGHYEIVQVLVRSGSSDLDYQDIKKRTPLSWAASYGNVDIVKFLLECENTKVDQPDVDGGTPLIWAASLGHHDAAELLLGQGKANAGHRDNKGRTAISWAAVEGYDSIVGLLMAAVGAAVDVRDIDGRTPLYWAVVRNHPEVVRRLLKAKDLDGYFSGAAVLGFSLSEAVRICRQEIFLGPPSGSLGGREYSFVSNECEGHTDERYRITEAANSTLTTAAWSGDVHFVQHRLESQAPDEPRYPKHLVALLLAAPLINTKLDSVSKASKDALDRQAAIAIFVSGKPYSLYEEPETLKLFQMLNTAYKPPDGNRIASFLEPVYLDYRQRVKALLDDAPHLNIIFDASDDISSNRIINVAVEIPNSVAFYWTTFDTKDHDHSALATLSLIRPALVDIFGHDFSRLNALCTDTCSTMRKLHREMKALPEFSHCLYVLCDSHGLQLLVKDIVESKRWMPTLGKVTYLIGFFKKAKLQLSRLRIHQQECYGRRKAFITAAITRWGTQLAAVRSLFDNKDALRAFARDPATLNGLKQPIVKEEEHETQSSLSQAISYINDIEFWADVEMLFKVLEPIGRAQVSSERDRAGLGEVIPRWLSIQAAWDALEEAGQDPLINYQELKVLRKQRFDVQTDDIHYMAFALDPATTEPKHKFLTTDIVRRAHNFLEESTNAEDYGNIFREFCQFRAREGSLFGPGSRIHRAECDDAPHHQHVLDTERLLQVDEGKWFDPEACEKSYGPVPEGEEPSEVVPARELRKGELDTTSHVDTAGFDRLREHTPSSALSTSQTVTQLPKPTGTRLPPSSGKGTIFSIELPHLNLEREGYLEISDASDAPQNLTTGIQTPSDFPDGLGVFVPGPDQQQVADAALDNLEQLLRSVFAAAGQALRQESGFERNVTLTPNQEVIMTATTQQEVHDMVHQVIGLCCLQRVPIECLLQTIRLSEASMKHVEGLEVRPDMGWDQTAVVSWMQRISAIETALRGAQTCARILSGGRDDRQLYSESVINRCVDILNTVTEDVAIPLVELRNSAASADLFKMVRRYKDAIASVFAGCRGLITVLTELVTKIELPESVTNMLEFAASKLIFVDSVCSERDSVVDIQLVDGIRFAAIDMLCQIFINKPDQRQGMTDDILHSLKKLPVGKQCSRQYKLSGGGSIQPFSALIMRLVQAGSRPVLTDEGSRAAFVRSMAGDEDVEYDESRTAEKGQAAVTALADEEGAQQHASPIQDLEATTVPLAACATRTASYIIHFMVNRAVGTTKTRDAPYRSLLDVFVEDLTSCLGSPDWPSAELLLRLLMFMMVQLTEAPNTAAPTSNMALELLGTMSAAISRLRSQVKQTAGAFEGSDELSQCLSGLATHVLEQTCQMEHIGAWSDPLRATLGYLEGQCSEDPHLYSAVSFIITDWASGIRSAYDFAREADSGLHHELGRLAYRLRLMIDDKKQPGSEDAFKAVTASQARFAFSTLLLLRSPLCKSFNRVFHVLLGSIASDQATVRSKSLKSVDQVLESDPSILDGDSTVVQLILDCSSDSSMQVRDSALVLLGKCIGMRPALESCLIPKIVDRLQDAGVAVRKRAMKLACDVYLSNRNMGLRSAIANGLLRRIQDPDEGVRDLARQVIEQIWFAPFYGHGATPAVDAALLEHVALIIQTVKTGTVAAVLDRVLRSIAKPSNRSLKGPFTVCSRLVDIMFGLLGKQRCDNTSIPSCRDILQVLTIFAQADPKLFSLEQIRLLKPHLADFTGQDELAAFRAATIICKRVLPQLPTAQSDFLAEVRLHLLRGMGKIPSRGALDDLIECTRTVCELLNDSRPLASLVASSLLRIQELGEAPLDKKRIDHLCAYAIIVGSIARHCDLDKQLHTFRATLPRWQSHSVPRLIVDTLLPFALPSQSSKARQAAIEAIGLVCQSWPRNYVLPEVHMAFQQVFQDRNSVLETMILRSFKEFLITEERRSGPGVTAAAAKGDEEQLTVMGGTGFDDVSSVITQSFLNEITRIALGSQSEHAFLALEVLGSIRRQGLTHPKDIGVTLITLETSTNRKIAQFAFMEHRSLHERHETVLEREYVKAVQSAYNYQRDVIKDSHGATVNPFQSKLHLLMEVLKISKLKNRQRFLEKLCSQTDFELSTLDATMGLPPHVEFVRFILENVAFFEYQTIGEVQTVVDTLEKIVTDTGTAVAQAIESEIFNVRLDANEVRQDSIAAEPVAAMSADDCAVAEPRAVAGLAGFALPVEPRRLCQLTTASMALLSLWEACIYLRKLYNVSTDRRGTNAKVLAKELSKQPLMTQGVHEDKFWDAVASHMRGLQSGETMMKTCRLLVELMNMGRDLEGSHGDKGPDALSWEPNENRPERGRKRKAGATPRKRKERAQTSSRPRKRKRKHIAESSEDESDGDWM
ncbi:restless-like transposase [Purpureocillium lavendulum]|uniref:Sister chromatid cohesion protein n=1 Tax=Purpureocillium lavendulum TaxID=1247861 RepID=A0AB34FD58_9HYPO|nr:restless-like transposase [Purpureocillium lavendulum]